MEQLLSEIPPFGFGVRIFPLRARCNPLSSVASGSDLRRVLVAVLDSAARTEVVQRALSIGTPRWLLR